MQKHHTISKYKTIVYCWIPSHIGIRNNERVDKKAKESLNLEETVFKIPFNNFKPFINRYIFDKWQTFWNEIDNCNSHDKFIIFSDSFSVLQALNHTSLLIFLLRPKTHRSKTFCKNIIQFQNIKL